MDVPRRNVKRLKLTQDAIQEKGTCSSGLYNATDFVPKGGDATEDEDEEEQYFEDDLSSEEEEEGNIYDDNFDECVDFHEERNEIMTHGYGIVSQLALVAAKGNTTKPEQETLHLGEITGAVCNIDETLDFKYPSEPPFSGKKIELRVEMPRKRNEAAHVLIKKLIFTLLGRACTIPTDIQSINWLIPDDTIGTRSANPQPFPRVLYDNIQKILLQYFRIDEEILSRGFYDENSCKNLLCLRGICDENSRQIRYNTLHFAREKFLRYTFHAQFKAALVDLKRSTYTPPPTGQAFGIFKLHSHAKRSRADEADS
ncbi:hypothetical protein CAEBREN_01798 [Caenorhabditis brenneri]|uniref:Uncharacterized protein n=1 Tax=Caenorhabditis brenneri TaxID=135651 RepID=G0MNE2_CAEBE|nr:hypothetical protein CAEBREN_01798 [Caenorhabditis brenneri]